MSADAGAMRRSWLRRGVLVLLGLALVAGLALLLSSREDTPRGPGPALQEDGGPSPLLPTLHGAPPVEPPHPGGTIESPPSERGAPGPWLLGRVVNATDSPVPGARVRAFPLGDDESPDLAPATSDEQGRYRVSLVPLLEDPVMAPAGRRLRVRAWKPTVGYGEADLEGVSLEADAHLDVRLVAASLIHARVVDPAREPVAEASAYLGTADGRTPGVYLGASESDGQFVSPLTLDEPTPAHVVFWHPEVGSAVRALTSGLTDYALGDVALEALPTIRGRVVFPDGSAVSDAAVQARLTGAGTGTADPLAAALRGSGQASVRTDPAGGFVVAVPAATTWSLGTEGAQPSPAQAGDSDVTLVVEGVLARVRVLDEEGRVLRGVGLLAMGWDAGQAAVFEAYREGRIDASEAREAAAWVSAWGDGSRSDQHLERGTFAAFLADVPGFAPAEETLRVPEEGHELRVDLVIRPFREWGRLRLRCLLPDGALAAAARVRIETRQGGSVHDAVVDLPDGLPPLPAIPLTVEAIPCQPGTRPREEDPEVWARPATARVTVQVDAVTDLELFHELGGRLRLLLRPPAGASVPQGPDAEGFRNNPGVRVVDLDTQQSVRLYFVHREDEQGRAVSWGSVAPLGIPARSATLLRPGRYRLDVAASGSGWKDVLASTEVAVQPGEFTEVTLDLPRLR